MKKIILLMFIICLILSGCSSTKMERGTYKKRCAYPFCDNTRTYYQVVWKEDSSQYFCLTHSDYAESIISQYKGRKTVEEEFEQISKAKEAEIEKDYAEAIEIVVRQVSSIGKKYGISDIAFEDFKTEVVSRQTSILSQGFFYLKSEAFFNLPMEEKLEMFYEIYSLGYAEDWLPEENYYTKYSCCELRINSGDHTYGMYKGGDRQAFLLWEDSTWNTIASKGGKALGNTSSSSSNRTCPNCNGTGSVKFYYGSSALEAWLDGYDNYTVGDCPMCNGRGSV